MNIIKNIISNYQHFWYTCKHILAFNQLQKTLGYRVLKPNYFHDWDKLILYILCPYLNTKFISKIHRHFSKHHLKYEFGKQKGKYKNFYKINFEECVIDWECARYTKLDKQLNTYETMIKYYPEVRSFVYPILRKFKLI